MSTPHIAAEAGGIAPTVLLPGDPLRARHLARQFLSECVEVSTRRNMLAYSGRYRGERITIMGSGMGIPSCAIYATELARVYGVRRIVRVGTCGGIGDVEIGGLLMAQSAATDSGFNRLHFGGHDRRRHDGSVSRCVLLTSSVPIASTMATPASLACSRATTSAASKWNLRVCTAWPCASASRRYRC